MKKIFFLALLITGLNYSTTFAQLPQKHNYQVVLQKYMKKLQKEDFKVSLDPLTLNPSYFSNIDEAYQAWLSFGFTQQALPETRGLRVDAKYFTLESIETKENVYMSAGKSQFIPTIGTAFYADWNYEGNPHYDSRAVKLRAFVAAAVDMMMVDQAHANGHYKRSDFLGLELIKWAYPYCVAKEILPQNVQQAYETGLIRMFSKIEKWGPTGTHADMDMGAIVGMLYVAKCADSGKNLTARAHQYINLLFDKYLADAGYVEQGGAYDGGYNGIGLFFINWGAQLSEYQPSINQLLVDGLQKMSKFKAHQILPDPDDTWVSPTHSNTSSPHGAAHDYWSPYYRDVGIARFADQAVFLAISGKRYGLKSIRSKAEMIDDMRGELHYFNGNKDEAKFTIPSNATPEKWDHEYWIDSGALATVLYYEKGLYDKLKRLQNSSSPLAKPPLLRSKKYTKSFADKFLSIKRNTYGTIIFNDRLSWWNNKGDTNHFNGFGGGNISYFWTPSTGTVILGVTRTSDNGPGLGLKDWRILPVHALTGVTTSGNAFTSAIQRLPQATYELNRNVPRVVITGDLSNIYSDPTKSLDGEVKYKRVFEIYDNGLKVTSSVITGSSENVAKLYEIIPVYRRNASNQGQGKETKIAFEVNGSWQSPNTNFQRVSCIRLTRFDGKVYIEFENPVRAKLSPHEFYLNPNKKSGFKVRNIMIDMLAEKDHSVTYFIRSSKAPPHNWNSDGNGGNGGNDPKDTTVPETKISISPKTPDNTQKVTFTAEASDKSGIKKLLVFVDEDLKKTCKNAKKCKVKLGPYKTGKHTYHTKAVDGSSQNNKKKSEKETFKVREPHAPNASPVDVSIKLKKQSETLKAKVSNVKDPDGDQVFLTYDWRVDGKSIALVNVPFDINAVNSPKASTSKNRKLKNYSTYKNPLQLGSDKTSPKWTAKGKRGGALVFDGVNDYVKIETDSSFKNLEKFTIEAWIKHSNWGENWATIISKPYDADSWKKPWAVFKLSRKSNTDRLNLQITVGKNKAVNLVSKQEIPANEWSYLTATYDGKNLKLYINGELDNTLKVNKPLATKSNTDVFIAKNSKDANDTEQFKGVIDEVRIYNVALSKKQVKQHYSGKYDQLSLEQVDYGKRWTVAVTANDTKVYAGEPEVSNVVILSDEVSKAPKKENWLAQNYPNPFRDKTTIQYKIDQAQTISLKVYSTIGRLVRTLYSGKQTKGTHKIVFKGNNLASGVYLVVLTLEGKTITRKMTLFH